MWLCLLVLLGLYFLHCWYREKKTIPNLPDKYVLITGCDSGFGHLLARQLDRRGLFVLAACFTQEGAGRLKEAASRRLQTVILDVSDSGSVAAMAHWVKRQVGDKGLWGLVNNAGTGIPGAPNEWLTKDDFVRVLNVNLLGTIDVTLNLLPLVRKARGRVVVVSSIVGRITFCGGGYCISKFGLEAFSDSLRRELCHFGAKVSIIEPGYFKTQLNVLASMKAQLSDIWGRLSPSVKESYGQEYFDQCMVAEARWSTFSFSSQLPPSAASPASSAASTRRSWGCCHACGNRAVFPCALDHPGAEVASCQKRDKQFNDDLGRTRH